MKNLTRNGPAVSGFFVHINQSFLSQISDARLFAQLGINMSHIDVIGDIHGHADHLHQLLNKMDYRETNGFYAQPGHKVLFLGDFIDRGPEQIEVLRIVRAMCANGSAMAVMGNHEFNAIGWMTKNQSGDYLRSHNDTHREQHQVFLDQVGEDSPLYHDIIDWFRSLPAFLDLGHIRAVHACWHEPSLRHMSDHCLDQNGCFTDIGFSKAHIKSTSLYDVVEVSLKGPEQKLPNNISFHDKSGHLRHHARVRWWDKSSDQSLRTAVLGMEGREHDLPDHPIHIEHAYLDTVPVFFGHYWLSREPHLTSSKAPVPRFFSGQGWLSHSLSLDR